MIDFLEKHPKASAVVDSRKVVPGDLFFALQGERVDGHLYLPEAIERGAALCIVEKEVERSLCTQSHIIEVESSLETLQSVAKEIFSKQQAKVIALTGSVGKSTTREFLRALLSVKGKVGTTPYNYNSQIGLPLTIINHLDGDEEFFVLEMGMTHPGHIARLVEIAPPDIALLIGASYTHSENFSSLEEIARAKGEIFSSPKTTLGIVHHEIAARDQVREIGCCAKKTFSLKSRKADYFLSPSDEGEAISIESGREKVQIAPPALVAPYLIHNYLAALSVARELGLTWSEIEIGGKQLSMPKGRFETVEKGGVTVVSDAYNASLLSVKAALSHLPAPKKGGRKVAVLGGMAELGIFSERCHREVGELSLKMVDQVFCIGKECAPIVEIWRERGKEVPLYDSYSSLASAVKNFIVDGDVVLLKGSNKFSLWNLLEVIEG